jgi:hypothetical protein
VILRHGFPPSENRESELAYSNSYLQGWGAVLDIKNMEYKAVDDRELNDDSDVDQDNLEAETEVIEQAVGGFFFDTLEKRLPKSAKNALDQLKEELTAEDHVDAPLKSWELTEIVASAAARIANSADKLQALVELSQNFPAVRKLLPRATAAPEFQNKLRHFQR